jgi:hypothetical protein
MNRFEHHHQESISLGYSCFDRLVFNGYIPAFQHSACGGTIYWFLRSKRQAPPLSRAYLAGISSDYHDWLDQYAKTAGIEIIRPEKKIRREELVEPAFQQLGDREGVAVILKARETERIAWYFAKTHRTSVERRFIDLFYFYLNDPICGRMFIRVCPYFPFNISVWLNGHNWLASKMRQEGIAFTQRDNLFTACANPQRLQELSNAFGPADIVGPVEKWLTRLLPFFSEEERQQGYRHQLYMSQVEYCHNLIFQQKASLERLFDRLMDANRGMGHPDKLAIVFGRQNFYPDTRTGQTVAKITEMRTPVICSSYSATGIKQYVKDGEKTPVHNTAVKALRTESSSHRLNDLSIPKNINNMEKVRTVMDTANNRYLQVQEDILATYVDRGQLEELRQPTVSQTGRRSPGLHIDDLRLIASARGIGFGGIIQRHRHAAGHLALAQSPRAWQA